MTMDNFSQPSWEPDPKKMGNWRAMFEPGRPQAGHAVGQPPSPEATRPVEQEPMADEPSHLDMAEYKPWVLQRGRSRPTMMLHLRRFEPKSGLWMGWQLSYPHLLAVEYVGDTMLSLDFGTRQFMIEGNGLGELTPHLQSGSVLLLQEFSQAMWSSRASDDPAICSIKRL
jgi:hypothetical protein